MDWHSASRAAQLRALDEELRIVRAELEIYSEQIRALTNPEGFCTPSDALQMRQAMDDLTRWAAVLREELVAIHASRDDIEPPGGWTAAA